MKQQHYGKALTIYKRLLNLTPSNEYLRLKVSEISKLKQKQKAQDVQIDPEVADSIETAEVFDAQIRFLNELLGKLD